MENYSISERQQRWYIQTKTDFFLIDCITLCVLFNFLWNVHKWHNINLWNFLVSDFIIITGSVFFFDWTFDSRLQNEFRFFFKFKIQQLELFSVLISWSDLSVTPKTYHAYLCLDKMSRKIHLNIFHWDHFCWINEFHHFPYTFTIHSMPILNSAQEIRIH